MKESLWRRRAYLFVTGFVTSFGAHLFSSTETSRFFSPRHFAVAAFYGIAFSLIGEKPSWYDTLKLEQSLIQTTHALCGDRFHTYPVKATFNVLSRDPGLSFVPPRLSSVVFFAMTIIVLMWLGNAFPKHAAMVFIYLYPTMIFGVAASLLLAKRRVTPNGDGVTVRALLRKPTFIAWKDIDVIEFWKRADGEDDIFQVLVLRDANGVARLCLQPAWMQKIATQKFFNYLRTAAPTASTREVAKMS